MSDAERWLPVAGYEDRYTISDDGRVRVTRPTSRTPADGILKPTIGPGGYGQVCLTARDGKRRTRRIHKLVLDAFVGPKPGGCCCRHLDGNPSNSVLSNLAWGTYAENAADTKRHGRVPSGEDHWCAKLTNAQVADIKRRVAAGERVIDLASGIGVDRKTITRAVSGRSWADQS